MYLLASSACGRVLRLLLGLALLSGLPAWSSELINGGAIAAGIVVAGQEDRYTFFVNAGETVAITAAKTSGTLAPYVQLFAPGGSRVASDFNASVASIQHAATVAGTYTLMVSDGTSGRAQTGAYEARLARMPGANEHGALVNGGVRPEQITLGDLDTYTFFVNAGETVAITATKTSGTLAPYVQLFAPGGSRVASDFNASVASIQHTVNVAGVYTLLVSDGTSGRAQTGGYRASFTIDGSRLSYAALGDSYSSGEGVRPYRDLGDTPLSGCHRSTRAYPTRIRWPGSATAISQRSDSSFDFFACSGAVTDDVRADGTSRYGELPQMHPDNAIDGRRDLITISIGGNDVQFADIFKYCMAHHDCNGVKPFAPKSEITLGDLAPLLVASAGAKVVDIHARLRAAATDTSILALGYPILLSGKECPAAQFPPFGESDLKLSASEQVFLRGMNGLLNDVIEESARLTGLHFVDIEQRFTGHEVCGDLDDWINGVVLFDPTFNPKASVHPTARGQLEYANAVNDYLAAITVGERAGRLATRLPKNPLPATSMGLRSVQQVSVPAALPEMGELRVTLAAAPAGCARLDNVLVPGQGARLRGTRFVAHETVSLSLVLAGVRIPLETVAADAGGALDTVVTIPVDLPAGRVVSVEALGGGSNGAGRLLLDLARIESSASLDTDGDGVPDLCDNCSAAPNADQRDTDGDGYGNVCDADFDNNGLVNTVDLAALKAAFGQRGDDKAADLDGDFIVNTLDLAIFKSLFGKPPGPAYVRPGSNR